MSARTILTIDGLDGSGKSTFARALFAGLEADGHKAVIVKVDDFRRPIDWSSHEPSEADRYYDAYYDLELCERCLAGFVAGAPGVTIPVFDSTTERLEGSRTLVFEGTSVAVVEGVFPLRIPSAAAGTLIYLDTSEAEARRRIIERDLKKGRSREEIERRIDRRYFPSQARYRALFQPRVTANVVVDNEHPMTPRVIKRDLVGVADALRSSLERTLPRPG